MSKQIHPYIFFDGNCREAMQFYEKLGIGKIQDMITNADAPAGQEYDPAHKDRIMHGAITVGTSMILTSDAPGEWYRKPQGFDIHLTVEDAAEADRIFAALAEGGEVHMPLEETFWAQRFGALVDRFGIPWMVSVDKPQA